MNRHLILEDRKLFNELEVSDNLGVMNWFEAVELCKSLGKGWRLPTKEELNILYKNKEEVCGFIYSYYWSSTENDNKLNASWEQNFKNGTQNYNNKYYTAHVRAVRSC
jgi:hypothetical protein